MKREAIISKTAALNVDVAAPLSPSEQANGWTPASQRAAQSWLSKVTGALRDRTELPALDIGRGLDHWGVEGGPLMEKLCELSNDLREIED